MRPVLLAMVAVSLVVAGCSRGVPRPPTRPTTTLSITATSTTATTLAAATSTTIRSPDTTDTTTVRATTTTATAPVAPPEVTGLTATAGGGSGEVDITWPPLPASDDVAFYKLYKRLGDGTVLSPANVTEATLGALLPGRLGVTDAPDFGPWPTTEYQPGPRCYQVSAVSSAGIEGPLSADACGSPVGG